MSKGKAERPLINPMDQSLGFQLRRASNAMIADLSKRLAPLDLTVTKGSILLLIDQNPGITQIQTARVLAVKRANMAPLISALEKAGMVSKTRVDGRSHGLQLTEFGQQMAHKVKVLVDAHENKFSKRLTAPLLAGMIEELPAFWRTET